ncbi:MAG: hypothetical protein A3G33_10970 [Omnitrophica bacterium RIFCSPLOWO2_12_FULL_44_17]|uniref:Uncharacterized protein n=1 Tax=Candidatus Danuiimicrobium aquiferis TaxID=1801832 RepID=A0A1G1KSY8_9BACT|nr:MAG: hypothetical protein A3B72_01150 [Omnitrophica bacterium RIFCSPHIGHO2_02_FULL_45_28]OGW88811.1 MAG: hypothetical protein A3E74_04515 [Omnitrophica bacterium RIFCSPHIGHO2_12_FULL_44_12]OGW96020.1 MAG: hypothetical protein A3G33_10970 [Omnitrophica bacterium RIFCSPLOWO2_12_FULL_44_17]
MEYTRKHKNLIAKLFKKAGMLKEAKVILSCDDYKHEIASAMRNAASKAKVGIGAKPALLDAARRYETRECAIFKECTLPHCEGGAWCDIYNLGGSHGYIGSRYRHMGKSAFDVPLRKRRKLMLEMLEYKTRNKCTKEPPRGAKGMAG